jgi:outer membrane protein
MSRLNLIATALILLTTANPLLAEQSSYSLFEVYELARQYDARFNAARADREASQELLPQARSQLLPNISANINMDYIDQETDYSGNAPFQSGQRDFRSEGYGIKLTQPLYRKDRFEQYKQARVGVSQGDTQLAIAEQQLILTVSRVYFDVLLAQETIKLAEAEQAANKEQLARAKRGFEVGSATITDVHEAQSRFDLATAREIAIRNREQITRRRLSKLIGIFPQLLRGLGSKLTLTPPQPAELNHWTERASQHNLTVLLAQQQLKIASLEIERIRGVAYPSLDLVVSYDDKSADDSSFGVGTDTTEARIGLEAKIPLYAGGAVGSHVRQKTAIRNSAKLQLDAAHRDAMLLAEDAYLSITNGLQQIDALSQALLSSEKTLASTERGFELGLRTGVDVLDAQQHYFSAKRDLAQARYDYLFNRLQLKAAVGNLGGKDVEAINALMTE